MCFPFRFVCPFVKKVKKTSGFEPQPIILYGTPEPIIRDRGDHYSPHCLRRPSGCRRICINCTKSFWSYNHRTMCNLDCNVSHAITRP